MKFMLFTYRDPNVQLDPEQRATVPAAKTCPQLRNAAGAPRNCW
jgi:hypothetical protein